MYLTLTSHYEKTQITHKQTRSQFSTLSYWQQSDLHQLEGPGWIGVGLVNTVNS
jgi:hypothetical protein